MDDGSKTLLKGLLVVLALALSKEHLLDVREIDHIILVSAMTALTLVFSHERSIDTIRYTNGKKYNINENLTSMPAVAENTLNKIEATLPQLTPKEADVLNLMSRGLKNKEIAKKLDVSDSTVRNYLNSVLRKLNTSLTSNSAVKVVRQGVANFMNNLHYHNYHKGSNCFYKPILCQEGWCSNCIIYRENAIETSLSVHP